MKKAEIEKLFNIGRCTPKLSASYIAVDELIPCGLNQRYKSRTHLRWLYFTVYEPFTEWIIVERSDKYLDIYTMQGRLKGEKLTTREVMKKLNSA